LQKNKIMKRFTLTLITVLIVNSVFSQDITGTWYGKIKTPNNAIRINFNIKKDSSTYITTMDSPDQGAFNIKTSKTNFKNNKLEVFMNNLMINYKGTLINDSIKGTFTQRGMPIKLNLSKHKIKAEKAKKRPQDPIKPFPYHSEEVVFTNKNANNIQLSGTLTIPNNVKNPTVVILISGSGPQNRNEEVKLLNHRPFLVLSDFLTKNGIAVLRYDDRGIAKSEGNFKGATTFDFASDTNSAIDYLKTRKDLSFSKIGLIGHSEGGLIAPILASKRKDIDFIILLAGPGIDGGKILETQKKQISLLSGLNPEIIQKNDILTKEIHQIVKNAKNTEQVKNQLIEYFTTQKELPENVKQQYIQAYSDKWLLNFVKIDPKDYLNKVTCPILALNGSKDIQVLPKINLEAISNATSKNKQVTIKELKGLNHLFQNCTTGNINEYAKIDETINPKVLHIIVNWIKNH